ncbi:MAG: hypothetical protein V4850_25625 [Myxococcota bacterium]
MLLLVLVGCGGQSGENDRTGADCEAVSAEPLAGVSETDWPEGLGELLAAYEGLEGQWTGTLRCLDQEDRVATIDIAIDDSLVLNALEGASCDEDATVTGSTSFSLVARGLEENQSLETGLFGGAVLMSGVGIDLRWLADGSLSSSALDPVRWSEAAAGSDATCELVEVAPAGEP